MKSSNAKIAFFFIAILGCAYMSKAGKVRRQATTMSLMRDESSSDSTSTTKHTTPLAMASGSPSSSDSSDSPSSSDSSDSPSSSDSSDSSDSPSSSDSSDSSDSPSSSDSSSSESSSSSLPHTHSSGLFSTIGSYVDMVPLGGYISPMFYGIGCVFGMFASFLG